MCSSDLRRTLEVRDAIVRHRGLEAALAGVGKAVSLEEQTGLDEGRHVFCSGQSSLFGALGGTRLLFFKFGLANANSLLSIYAVITVLFGRVAFLLTVGHPFHRTL